MKASNLRALFSHLVLAAVAPLGTLACGGVAVGAYPGTDSGEGADSGADSGTHPGGDSGSCTPQVTKQPCGATVVFPCGVVSGSNGTPLDPQTCNLVCGSVSSGSCSIYQSVSPGGSAFISCGPCGTGRRPAGLSPARPTAARDHLGAWLAATSHLEAASVPAFEQLAEGLARHGAPRTLVVRARAAARDEVRHARATGDLARRRGASAPRVEVRPTKRASLARLARENAVEGCVRETYGALVATWQATNARDPEIGAAMAKIARDETRHAALAWAIHAWASEQLSPAQRGRVERARRAAARALVLELGSEPAEETRREAGVPEARVARALARSLDRALARV